jgi:glycosyltransferase involved in cell wall biosynthesis
VRILQLHNHHASLGGAMEVLAHEGSILAAAGHDVEQYTLPAAETLGLPAWRAGAKAVWNVEAARDVSSRIAAFKPDVVHVHTPFPLLSPSVFRAAYAAGVPAVTTLHSYRYSCVVGTCVRDGRICEDCVGSKLKLPGIRHACYHDSRAATTALTLGLGIHRAAGTFHKAVTRYLTLTDFARRLMVRDGYPAERIFVKPNSVPDPGVEGRREGGPREFFFAGRLIKIKGVLTLLEAWRDVPPGMKLVIAGDGELRPIVEAAAAKDSSIEFLGWVDEETVTNRMRDAEVVLVPSEWYEGQPLVMLRSLAVGTPLLTSDLENICEDVMAAGCAWTFETGNVGSLRDRLTELIEQPELAADLRKRCRDTYVESYSPAADLIRLERTYDEVCAEVARGA